MLEKLNYFRMKKSKEIFLLILYILTQGNFFELRAELDISQIKEVPVV